MEPRFLSSLCLGSAAERLGALLDHVQEHVRRAGRVGDEDGPHKEVVIEGKIPLIRHRNRHSLTLFDQWQSGQNAENLSSDTRWIQDHEQRVTQPLQPVRDG